MSLKNYGVINKKDKQVLVLLVFGVLILLSDIGLPGKEAVFPDHGWIELQEGKKQLYRINVPEKKLESAGKTLFPVSAGIPVQTRRSMYNFLKEHKSVSIKEIRGKWTVRGTVSPRLNFFLGQPFSINNATADDLVLIPGIGPSLASSIIDYRLAKGPVSSERELTAITGIGSRMKQRLQHYFTYTVSNELE